MYARNYEDCDCMTLMRSYTFNDFEAELKIAEYNDYEHGHWTVNQ